MCTITYNENEEAQTHLKDADCQIAEVQHMLSSNGTTFFNKHSSSLPLSSHQSIVVLMSLMQRTQVGVVALLVASAW